MPYKTKPVPCYLDGFKFFRVIDGRKVYVNNYRYYSWDELHGEIEVFDKQGYHLGALHGVSGSKIKSAKRGRQLNVK